MYLKHDESCIKNDESCIKNDEFRITNEGRCWLNLQTRGPLRAGAAPGREFCLEQMMDFALKMMDFALKMMDFAFQMVGFIFQMMNLALK